MQPHLIAHDDTTIRIDAPVDHLRAAGLLPAWLAPLPGRKIVQWQRDGLTCSLHRLSAYFGADLFRVLVRESAPTGKGMSERLAAMLAADVLRRASRG